jgi:hypothetical protein
MFPAGPLLINDVIAANTLSVRPAALRRMANRGQIPSRLLPDGKRRFDPEELRTWVSQLKRAEPVPA